MEWYKKQVKHKMRYLTQWKHYGSFYITFWVEFVDIWHSNNDSITKICIVCIAEKWKFQGKTMRSVAKNLRTGYLGKYSKTCLIWRLCNLISFLLWCWLSCPFDNFLCVLHCVIQHPAYSNTKSLKVHVRLQVSLYFTRLRSDKMNFALKPSQ